MGALLPHKRVRAIIDSCDDITRPQIIALRIVEHQTEREMIVGGRWYPTEHRYKPLNKRERRRLKKIYVHAKQWQLIVYMLDALENYKFRDRGESYIQEILNYGARQIGKSEGTGIGTAVCLVAKPAAKIAVLAPRGDGARRIVGILKRIIPQSAWKWDKAERVLTLMNHSKAYARSARVFDDLRGWQYDAILLDEAAKMDWEVRMALTGNLITRNGFFVYMTTPRGHNWIWDVHRKKDAGGAEPKAEDIRIRQTVREVQAAITDNTFLSPDAIDRAKQEAMSLSENEYRQEILGEFIPSTGLAFPNFKREQNVHSIETMDKWGLDDITRDVTNHMFGIDASYVIGIDLNYDPNSCVFYRIASNGSVWAEQELQFKGHVDDFVDEIIATGEALGLEDVPGQCVVVIDASAFWQGTGKRISKTQAASVFQKKGFRLSTPQGGKRNPPREDRMNVTSRMISTKAGEVRLFLDPRCEKSIQMYEELPALNGVPDHKWKNAHIYDAGSYPLFRLFSDKFLPFIQGYFRG